MVRQVLSDQVSPEFVGRVTTMVPFCSLNREQITQIVDLQIVDFCRQASQWYTIQSLVVSREVWIPILEEASTEYGARLISKEVIKQIQASLTNALASGIILPGEPVLMKRALDWSSVLLCCLLICLGQIILVLFYLSECTRHSASYLTKC